LLTSSCPEGAGMCFASGPGRDMFESTKMIATRIYEGASVSKSRSFLSVRGILVNGLAF
jgi:neutral ceramidase